MEQWIEAIIREKIELLGSLKENGYLERTEKAGTMMTNAIKVRNKIILAGNGGSAADAQHFAGEIVGRFTMERNALPAISLCTDPCVVTCIANDYGYEEVFARQVEGLGAPGDVFVGISTSGNSVNLVHAMKEAKRKNLKVVGFLGKQGGAMKEFCDYALIVPSDCTQRIQEVHTLTVHILCELIEKKLFSDFC